jgi:hypothetical protein
LDAGTVAAVTAASTTSGGTLGIILLLVLIIVPTIWKLWNWSKETSAQGLLYQQLSEQVKLQREEIDRVYTQRNLLQEQVFELRSKVEDLEDYEKTLNMLKSKLDSKDIIIAERDARITALMQELLQMKDRVHNLEIRLKADEAKFCEGCKFKIGHVGTRNNTTSSQHLPPFVYTRVASERIDGTQDE